MDEQMNGRKDRRTQGRTDRRKNGGANETMLNKVRFLASRIQYYGMEELISLKPLVLLPVNSIDDSAVHPNQTLPGVQSKSLHLDDIL